MARLVAAGAGWAPADWPADVALAVGDVDPLVGRVVAHRGRIPADGDEAERLGLARLGDVEDGEVVGVGVGDEQQLAVGRQAQAVGRVARWAAGIEGTGDRLQSLAAVDVEDADLRRVGAGDEQRLAVGRKAISVGCFSVGQDAGRVFLPNR